MNQTQKTDGVKQAPLYEAVARDIAKEIDRQILGGDPDNKPGEHYYDIMTMTRIASEYTYALEQEYQMSITQAIATATQQAVEVGCPWSGSEYAGWMPLEYNFKSKLDAKKWIEQKYLETKKDPDLIGKCSWTDKSKTKFKAKVETRFETECGMEYDETTIYYEIKPMEFEALSQK